MQTLHCSSAADLPSNESQDIAWNVSMSALSMNLTNPPTKEGCCEKQSEEDNG